MRLSTVSGVMVLVTGIIAVGLISYQAEQPHQLEAQPGTQQTSALVVETPDLDGIPPAIQRVLSSSGKLDTLDPNGLDDLPPEIARVLAYYGATLTIATPKEQEG